MASRILHSLFDYVEGGWAVQENKKAAHGGRPFSFLVQLLQSRLDFESPSLKKWFRDVLRIAVLPRPLAQTSRADVLVGSQLELPHNLLEFGYGWNDGANRFRLAPVRISTSLRHDEVDLPRSIMKVEGFQRLLVLDYNYGRTIQTESALLTWNGWP